MAATEPGRLSASEGGLSALGGQKSEPEILPKIPRRVLPPGLLEAALPDRPSSAVSFYPIRLVDLLSRPLPRNDQLRLIQAYWDLAAAVGTVSFRKKELAWLESLRVLSADQIAYQAAISEAKAALQSAETALAAAQQSFAQKAALHAKTVPPWPVDKPHVGPYSTMLEKLFIGRVVPRQLVLIDRCLPWWQKAIDRHAQAIEAAEDALAAFSEAYQQGRTDLRPILWLHNHWMKEHTAFLEATVAYNNQIAEFALAVAPPGAYGPSLVRLLILQDQGASKRTPSADGRRGSLRENSATPIEGVYSGVVPATYEQPPIGAKMDAEQLEPIPLGEPEPVLEGLKQQPPSSAASASGTAPSIGYGQKAATGGREEPTLAPPRPSSEAGISPSGSKSSVPQPLVPLVPESAPSVVGETSRSGSAKTGDSAQPTPSPAASLPKTQESSPAENRVVREAKKPPEPPGGFSEETIALYPGLLHAEPRVQVEQLALSLHGPTHLKENFRELRLLECLERVSGARRRELLEAYWLLWQQRAETIARQQQEEQLHKLGEINLRRIGRPLGAEERLLWRSALLAEEAELMEAQIRLLQRQEKLALLLGLGTEGNLLPATLPYTGPYNLRLEMLDRNARSSWPVRRAAGLVEGLYGHLQHRAKAVVQADQAQNELVQQYGQDQRLLHEVLAAWYQQKQTLLDFIQTLIDYNQAIADYVALVVPADLPAEKFLRTLVKEP
ncbi:MAG: hypothetical protein NZ602_07830 [Thermoguttaceae bacterium]|nr:hypothetical protein [Thermoguttaceae bacterium]MDW8039233.1 hypothetical protein [Thermoguttaceae bacterium]